MFIKENLNPKGRKTADCVVRAIAKAQGKSWLEVFDALTEIARKRYSVLNDKDVYTVYLKEYAVIPCVVETTEGNFKFTVKEFADSHNQGTYVVQVANHLTTVIDGDIYDTWNCSAKKIYKIWEVK